MVGEYRNKKQLFTLACCNPGTKWLWFPFRCILCSMWRVVGLLLPSSNINSYERMLHTWNTIMVILPLNWFCSRTLDYCYNLIFTIYYYFKFDFKTQQGPRNKTCDNIIFSSVNSSSLHLLLVFTTCYRD